MILTKLQAKLISALRADPELVVGRRKGHGKCVVFNPTTDSIYLDEDNVIIATHGRVILNLIDKGAVEPIEGTSNYRLTDKARNILAADLTGFTADGVPRVTEDGIKRMAKKYGYGFEFERVIGVATFLKDGRAVVPTSISIERISDMSLTEWEDKLQSYLRAL